MEHRWSTSVALFNAPYTDGVLRGNICQHRVPIIGCGGVWPGLFLEGLFTAVVGNTLQGTLLIFVEAPNQGMVEMA